MDGNITVAHLSSVHPSRDVRIFLKECRSIREKLNADVYFVVPEERDYINEGINILAVKTSKTRLSRILLTPAKVYIRARKINPDIVHFHDPELIVIGILFRIFGKKVIYDVHEDLPKDILSKDWIHPFLRYPVSWLAALTEWIGSRLFFSGIVPATPTIGARFPQRKVALVQNYPKIDEFLTLEECAWNRRKKQLVYVGVIDINRGAIENVRALEFLEDQDVRLLLAGPFSNNSLRKKCESLVGWRLIDYYPWLTRQEVIEALAQSIAGLVVLHPTPAYVDSLPIKMFEYMLAGIPVIASDFPLWRKIIEENDCGILVNPLKPEETADAIRWVVDNPKLAEEMGGKGRKLVEEKYNWGNEEKKLLGLYRKLLSYNS